MQVSNRDSSHGIADSSLEGPKPRCNLFKCLNDTAISCWKRAMQIPAMPFRQMARSVLGKTIIYTAADAIGASLGGNAGIQLLGKIGSQAGYLLGFGVPLAGVARTIQTIQSPKHERASKIIIGMMTLSTTVVSVVYVKDVAESGEQAGSYALQRVGFVAGTVLGGYIGLVFAGSPVEWKAYSIDTTRFLVVGMLYNGLIICPTSMAAALLRRIICVMIQVLAYNSSNITRGVEFYIKHKKEDGLEFSVVRPLVNYYSGRSAEHLSEKMAEMMASLIGFAIHHAVPLTTVCFGKIFNFSTANLFSQAVKNSISRHVEKGVQKTPHFVMNSLYNYRLFLNRSEAIKKASKEFEEAFFHEAMRDDDLMQEALIKSITDELQKDSKHFSHYETFYKSALTAEAEHNLMEGFKTLIRNIEVDLFGFHVLKGNRLIYLSRLVKIHLSLYLIYASIHFNEFVPDPNRKDEDDVEVKEDASAEDFDILHRVKKHGVFERVEESDFFIMISGVVFQYYVSAVTPSSVSRIAENTVAGTIKGFYNLQSHFRPPEQETRVLSPLPNFIGLEGKQDEVKDAAGTSLTPENEIADSTDKQHSSNEIRLQRNAQADYFASPHKAYQESEEKNSNGKACLGTEVLQAMVRSDHFVVDPTSESDSQDASDLELVKLSDADTSSDLEWEGSDSGGVGGPLVVLRNRNSNQGPLNYA